MCMKTHKNTKAIQPVAEFRAEEIVLASDKRGYADPKLADSLKYSWEEEDDEG